MIEILQDNLITILGLTSAGAFIGGVIGLFFEHAAKKNALSSAILSQARTLSGSLDQFKTGLGETQGGFEAILDMLAPDHDVPEAPVVVDLPEELNQTTDQTMEVPAEADQAEKPSMRDFASKLLAAVAAIPALPALPNFGRDFEMLQDNQMFDAVFNQLQGLETDGLNGLLGEFKTLIENNIKPGLERAMAEGGEFTLEPETIDTLTRSANEFVKSIGGLDQGVAKVMAGINEMIGRLN